MKKEKEELETSIKNLVKKFENDIGIKISWIEVKHENSVGFGNSDEKIEVKIKLKEE